MAESRRFRGEQSIVQRHFAPLAADAPGAYGLSDDCATLTVPAGEELVVTTDAVVHGLHVVDHESPDAIAWKALAVNISDLIAKGAVPLGYVMALALPGDPGDDWLAAFAGGLRAAQETFGCQLLGGDTDRTTAHLSVTITAFGAVPCGGMIRRGGARVGDAVYVTGSIGNATLGLRLRQQPELAATWRLDTAQSDDLLASFRYPHPPVAIATALRAHASAALDISDGLAIDAERLCHASEVGVTIDLASVPVSPAAGAVIASGGADMADLVSGGEDYQVLAAISPEAAGAFERAVAGCGVRATRIGVITGEGVVYRDTAGRAVAMTRAGWDHFA